MKKTRFISIIIFLALLFLLIGAFFFFEFFPSNQSHFFSFDRKTLADLQELRIEPLSIEKGGKECLIESYGAKKNNPSATTIAIQKAIEDCSLSNGGQVKIGPGTWVTYPFALLDNTHLHFEEGAILVFDANLSSYKETALWRFEGIRVFMTQPLIQIREVQNVSITGKGIIKGNSSSWNTFIEKEKDLFSLLYRESERREKLEKRTIFNFPERVFRPEVIGAFLSHRVLIEGITIQDAPRSAIRILMSDEVILSDVNVTTEAIDGDALVLDSSSLVRVEKGHFSSKNGDGISLQSGLNAEGRGMDENPLKMILIQNSFIENSKNAFSIDRAMSAGMNRIVVKNIQIKNVHNGIYTRVPRGVGGELRHFLFEDISFQDVSGDGISFDVASPDELIDLGQKQIDDTLFLDFFFSRITGKVEGRAFFFKNFSHENIVNSGIYFKDISLISKEKSLLDGLSETAWENISLLVGEKEEVVDIKNSNIVLFSSFSCGKEKKPEDCINLLEGNEEISF